MFSGRGNMRIRLGTDGVVSGMCIYWGVYNWDVCILVGDMA